MRGLRIVEARLARNLRREQTPAEARLWSKLRNREFAAYKFVRQEPIEPHFVDFVCREASLVVEVDGATHSTDEEVRRDARRTEFLQSRGYAVLRFLNADVFAELDGVLETILLALQERAASAHQPPAPHPNSLPVNGERE